MPSPLQSQVITNIYHREVHTIHPVVEKIVDRYAEDLGMSFDESEEGTDKD